MAAYNYASCDTMSPYNTVYTTTQYMIFDSVGHTPDSDSMPLYKCTVLPSYSFNHLEDILSQYVSQQDIYRFYGNHVYNHTAPIKTFYVFTSTDNWATYTGPDTITIHYDWDYNEDLGNPQYRSMPIEMVVDSRQFFLDTVWNSGSTMGQITVKCNGNTIWSYTADDTHYTTYEGGVMFWNVPNTGTTISVEEYNNKLWKVYDCYNTCYKYCIYYVNRLGGWDWLLVNGKNVQTETAEAYQIKSQPTLYNQFADYNIQYARKDFLKKITRSWELTRTNLTDRQAHLMHHLAFSNHIYLHNLETQEIIPVTFDDKSFEWKTWKTSNRKLSQCTFNLKASRDKYILN